ncbi:MAG: hypothetical protein IT323_22450, partial [Anaerolineae bacterium]|nr:hypothetical protein [Anaerolineae bacterium]
MLQDFSVLELAIYALAWAFVGGLPGYYLFFSLDRNPRSGARLGVLAGVAVGLVGALAGVITSAQAAVNGALALWLAALVGGIVLSATGKGMGNYQQRVTMRQRV